MSECVLIYLTFMLREELGHSVRLLACELIHIL